jgi:hypothetical protein
MAMARLGPLVLLPLGSHGVNAHQVGRSYDARSPNEFGVLEGQVGQESNLHPAVVEDKARSL